MIYRTLIFVLTLYLVWACHSDSPSGRPEGEGDSLAYYFERANRDSLPVQERIAANNRALAIVEKQPRDSMYFVNMFKVANRYWNANAWREYKNICLNLKDLSRLSFFKSKSLKYLADFYSKHNVQDSAYFYIRESIKASDSIRGRVGVAQLYLEKANLEFVFNDLINSEKSLYKAIYIFNKDKSTFNLMGCQILLSLIYYEKGDYNKSLQINLSNLRLMEDPKNEDVLFYKKATLNNIGLTYINLKKYTAALSYFRQAAKCQLRISQKADFTILNNLAEVYLKLGKPKEAKKLLDSILNFANAVEDISCIVAANLNLSEYYFLINDKKNAKIYGENALRLSRLNNLSKQRIKSLQNLIQVNPENSNVYFGEYLNITNSIKHSEAAMRDKFARIEYETDQLKTENEQLLTHFQKVSLAGSAVIIALLAGLIYRHLKARRREFVLLQEREVANTEILELIKHQQTKIEEGRELEKKRISQELHDGVMGKLSGIRLNLFVLNKKTDPKTIEGCLTNISKIQEVEKEIRTIAYDLESNKFDGSITFQTLVEELCHTITAHSQTEFSIEIDDIAWNNVESTQKLQMYRVLQEALQNIDKYAAAKKVQVRIKILRQNLCVLIEDDGNGFSLRNIHFGLGLKNMENRIKTARGKLKIKSKPGKGTVVTFTIPVK